MSEYDIHPQGPARKAGLLPLRYGWLLVTIAVLVACIPRYGQIIWFIGAPILVLTLILGIIAVTRRRHIGGLSLMACAVIVLPVVFALLPRQALRLYEYTSPSELDVSTADDLQAAPPQHETVQTLPHLNERPLPPPPPAPVVQPLAPQPGIVAPVSTPRGLPTPVRAWTNRSNGRVLHARVISIQKGYALFEMAGGKRNSLRISSLSDADQAYLREQL